MFHVEGRKQGWYYIKYDVWSLSPVPGTELLKSLEFLE